jgi:hypothetical protein
MSTLTVQTEFRNFDHWYLQILCLEAFAQKLKGIKLQEVSLLVSFDVTPFFTTVSIEGTQQVFFKHIPPDTKT